MAISIVRAAPDDASVILEFLRVVGGESDNLTFGNEGLPFTVEEEQKFLESKIDSETSAMFLAKEDGKLVGNVSFDMLSRPRLSHRGEIAISVLRSCWGKGVGSMLMQEAIHFARNTAHAELITLEVRSDNDRAIRLYEKFGFAKSGIYPGFMKIHGKWVDVDLMYLKLI